MASSPNGDTRTPECARTMETNSKSDAKTASTSTTSGEAETNSSSSSAERTLIKAVSEGCLGQVVSIVACGDVNLNCIDEHGMSPLQHACYKGNAEIVKFLLDRGADPNQNEHEHRYTSLMFAALGGHADVLNLLLEYGASVAATNSVGRNASQMAAFVGQHRSVAIINNFIAREHIEYYTKIIGLEKQPRLSVRLIQPVHALTRTININPVRIVFYLKSNTSLFDDAKMACTVLQLLCEKFLRANDPKEMLSIKLHYLAFVLEHVHKTVNQMRKSVKSVDGDDRPKMDTIDALHSLMKFWIKVNASGFPENMERLFRQSIRSYPYSENSLFQQLVRTLSTIEIGEEPSAYTLLTQAILGKSPDGDGNYCFTCGEIDSTKRCSNCKIATYCDSACQKLHWHVHKRQCEQLRVQAVECDKASVDDEVSSKSDKAEEVSEQAVAKKSDQKIETSESKENQSPNEAKSSQ